MAEEKVKNKYIFPDFLALAMSKVSMRTQLESSLMSEFLLMCGMILMGIYTIFYSQQGLFFKVGIALNLFFGFLFMSSYLVTTFQQYQNYLETMGIDTEAEKKAIKAKGNIFKRIWLAWKNRKSHKKIKELNNESNMKGGTNEQQ